tara:strand:+ start:144 stop:431 length:288 start_codon:yes stop_codon:yes gene_type:complete
MGTQMTLKETIVTETGACMCITKKTFFKDVIEKITSRNIICRVMCNREIYYQEREIVKRCIVEHFFNKRSIVHDLRHRFFDNEIFASYDYFEDVQ